MSTGRRYTLGEVIGAGGYAIVRVGAVIGSNEKFAVKLLAENLCHDKQIVARFVREAETLQRLTGPNIIRVHDVGRTAEQRPFFVMDFADRGSLQQWPGLGHALPADQAMRIIGQVVNGLARAHAQQIAHRDLKPDNILIATGPERSPSVDPGLQNLMLADFGLARALQEASRLTTVQAGTVPYMAPEQFEGRADLRTDVYALGVLSYYLLSGQLPFPQPGFYEVYLAKRVENYTPLARLRPDLPTQIADGIRKALSADPQFRPPDADAWFRSLSERAQAGQQHSTGASRQPEWLGTLAPPGVESQASSVNASPLARSMAAEQITQWWLQVRDGSLLPAQFEALKARKLKETALFGDSVVPAAHVSPLGQQMAIEQVYRFAELVENGALSQLEFQSCRRAILGAQGL